MRVNDCPLKLPKRLDGVARSEARDVLLDPWRLAMLTLSYTACGTAKPLTSGAKPLAAALVYVCGGCASCAAAGAYSGAPPLTVPAALLLTAAYMLLKERAPPPPRRPEPPLGTKAYVLPLMFVELPALLLGREPDIDDEDACRAPPRRCCCLRCAARRRINRSAAIQMQRQQATSAAPSAIT